MSLIAINIEASGHIKWKLLKKCSFLGKYKICNSTSIYCDTPTTYLYLSYCMQKKTLHDGNQILKKNKYMK